MRCRLIPEKGIPRTAALRAGECLQGILALVLALGCLQAANAYTRGRVKIMNYTVVSDQGTLLRGITTDIYNTGSTQAWNVAYWKQASDSGFNSMRLSVEFAQPWQTDLNIPNKLPLITQAVNAAEQAGMYVGIDYHDIGCHTAKHPFDFWNAVSPMFRDRTHVIYEINNEGNWPPENWTRFYKLIRHHAPLTHIIIFSSPVANGSLTGYPGQVRGVDWTRASAGYHPYSTSNPVNIINLHAKYPCITTELTPYPGLHDWNIMQYLNGNTADSLGWVKFHEQQQISWWLWGVGSASAWKPVLTYARRDGYMWQKDNFTTGPAVPFSATFAAGDDTIWAGDTLCLAWECPQATGVSIDNGIGAVSNAGSKTLVPAATTTYTLTAQGSGGPVTRQAAVVVRPLLPASNPAGLVPGLTYKCYQNSMGSVPDFTSYAPVSTGTCANFDLSVACRTTNLGMRYEGYFSVPKDTLYTFADSAMYGCKIYVDNVLACNNASWGIGGGGATVIGTVGLKAGMHAIRVDYILVNSSSGWFSVDMNWKPIPTSNLFRSTQPSDIEHPIVSAMSDRGAFMMREGILAVGNNPADVKVFDTRGKQVLVSDRPVMGTADLRSLGSGCYTVRLERPGCRRIMIFAIP